MATVRRAEIHNVVARASQIERNNSNKTNMLSDSTKTIISKARARNVDYRRQGKSKSASYTNRILPVSNSCIIPCLRARVLSRRVSRTAISASMSERTSAMAVCSALLWGNRTS